VSTIDRTERTVELSLEDLSLAATLGDSLTDGLILAGVDGRIRYLNPAAKRLLGWPSTSKEGHVDVSAIPVDRATIRRFATAKRSWVAEVTLDSGGQATMARIAFKPLARGGRRVGSLIVLVDRTEVLAAEKDRDLARENDRAKTRSLHLVAHDLSGPLTVLKGYVALLQEGKLSLEQFNGHVPVLVAQLNQIQRLVQTLLDTARLEEGRLELQLTEFDLVPFVNRLVAVMALPESRLRIVVAAGAGELPVMADSTRVESILRNVITNAIKYSPEGTLITCTVACVGDHAEVRVRDEGPGIAPADLDRLFRRFGRVGDVKMNPAGVGLGLFLSRQLARLHGGDLTAVSGKGQGSTFTLTLPICKVA
jgi:signal transduction histidine kinase